MAPHDASVTDPTDIDSTLESWRQGDVALDAGWFIHAGDPARPLTKEASEAVGEGPQALTTEVVGVVVLTQTCDVVRSCRDRPFVEISPLVEVDEGTFREVERARRPRFARVSAIATRRLVADLDRVMTVEKSILAGWTRTPGWATDQEAREFSTALARKRVRFAFPDDFNVLAKKLQARISEKHDKDTLEGRALRNLQEIRVHASPQWDAARVELLFWFVRSSDAVDFEGSSWSVLLDAWYKLLPASGRFVSIEAQVVAFDDITARDYVESDPLDLSNLSGPE